jgi:hypothetical protein
VIDVAGEIAARRGDRLEDYTQAVRHLARDPRFPAAVVRELERRPGFRSSGRDFSRWGLLTFVFCSPRVRASLRPVPPHPVPASEGDADFE